MNQSKKTIPKIASEKILLKGGKVVNHDLTFRADVFIENGTIRQLGTDLTVPGGVKIIDAREALILPGGVDVATHFSSRPPLDDCDVSTADDFYSGTRAALLGGTTTVFDFVTPDQTSPLTAHKERLEAGDVSCCDVTYHVDVTSWNDDVMKSMTELSKDHGVNSFRLRTSDRFWLDNEQIYDVLRHIKSLGGVAVVHAENGALIRKISEEYRAEGVTQPAGILSARNEDVEYEAVNRVLIIAKQVSCPIFFYSVTGKKALDAINEAQRSGQPVYGQAHAVALYRNGTSYNQAAWNRAASCVTWPPIRDHPDAQQRLLEALGSGTLQCVSSGHSVFTNTIKSRLGKADFSRIPPGTNGVYERMMALWSLAVEPGFIDQNQFVAMTSTNQARIFNIFPRKGLVAVGSDADLVVWREKQHVSLAASAAALNVTKADCSNAFEGLESSAAPLVVISRGKVVFDENEIHVVQSHGSVVERPPRPPAIYNRLDARDEAKQGLTPGRNSGARAPSPSPSTNGPRMRENPSGGERPERFTRTSGHRAMHQSGWSFSGDQTDDEREKKTNFRYSVPPGGLSQFSLS